MTPEERAILEETRNAVLENTKILQKMQRSTRVNRVFQYVYWLLIIGLSFGAFYFVQPYVDSLQEAVGNISGAAGTIQNAGDSMQGIDLNKILNSLKSL